MVTFSFTNPDDLRISEGLLYTVSGDIVTNAESTDTCQHKAVTYMHPLTSINHYAIHSCKMQNLQTKLTY
jgi:hypothetical protein